MLELKCFAEVDLNFTPIVVLGCGHFFTAETLDGHVGMAEVYEMDLYGEFVGLRDISRDITQSVPRCPSCQLPIRQYATQRYNRVINRAVSDEMSKRFLASGKACLQALECEAGTLEVDFEKSRKELLDQVKKADSRLNSVNSLSIFLKLESRLEISNKLARAVATFLNRVADKDQPARKLYDATVKAIRARQAIGEQMEQLAINDTLTVSQDRQVPLGGRAVQLKVNFVVLADKFELVQNLESIQDHFINVKVPGSDPALLATAFFVSCEEFLIDCCAHDLPKLSVEVRLYYSRIARQNQSYSFATKSLETHKATEYVNRAKELLEDAKKLCALGFQNADGLQRAVEEAIRLLGKEWYEPTTTEEIAAIKAAMVSGTNGIATHSGHWYNCQNGHPVSLAFLDGISFADETL